MRKLVQAILRTAERIKLSFGLQRFLDVHFILSNGDCCPKRSEVGFLENHGCMTNGSESVFFVPVCNDRAMNSLPNEMSPSSLLHFFAELHQI